MGITSRITHIGRNPRTGDKVAISEKHVPFWCSTTGCRRAPAAPARADLPKIWPRGILGMRRVQGMHSTGASSRIVESLYELSKLTIRRLHGMVSRDWVDFEPLGSVAALPRGTGRRRWRLPGLRTEFPTSLARACYRCSRVGFSMPVYPLIANLMAPHLSPRRCFL